MDVKTINSVKQYIEYIDQLIFTFPDCSIMENDFLFRGESDYQFLLLPSLYRKDSSGHNKYSNREQILPNFIQQAAGYKSNIPPTDYSQWSEYAQHYGVPTRLLDWTSNPLVALYFACKDSKDKNGKVSILKSNNYNVYITKKKNLSGEDQCLSIHKIINNCMKEKIKYEYPITYIPDYIDIRMNAQDSWFMAWGTNISSLEDILKDVRIRCDIRSKNNGCEIIRTDDCETLFKVKINKLKKQSILRELDMLGVNEKTLFPGLDGLGRYIEQRYRLDYNELVENF